MASLWNAVYFNDSEIITYLNRTVAKHIRQDVEFLTIDAAIGDEFHVSMLWRGDALSVVATVTPHGPGVMRASALRAVNSLNHIDGAELPALVTSEERFYNSLGDADGSRQRKIIDDLYNRWLDKIPYPGTVSIADVEHRGERLRFNRLQPLAMGEPAQAKTPTSTP